MTDDEPTVEYLIGDDEGAAPAPAAPLVGGRRRRWWPVIGGLLVLVVAGGIWVGPRVRAPEPPANPLPATGTAQRILLDRAGFGGAPGGSLAGDRAALAGIRTRVADLSTVDDHAVTGPTGVTVLWAGDLGSGRYAVALYKQSAGWSRVVLAGAAGASPTALTESTWTDDEDGYSRGGFGDPSASFVSRAPGGAVFVVAPAARGVEIAHARRFLPGGGVDTGWRSLAKQGGSVWAGLLDANEMYLSAYRTTDPDSDGPADVVGEVEDRSAAQAIATGSGVRTADGPNVVGCAAGETRTAGASLAERPVLATTGTRGKRTTLAAVVLRSPDGGWIWGICDRETEPMGGDGFGVSDYTGSGVARQRFASPAEVMAATSARLTPADAGPEGPPRWVVLAPLGADQVRIAGVTAPVRDRLAVVTVRRGAEGEQTAEALRNGRVVAHCPASSAS